MAISTRCHHIVYALQKSGIYCFLDGARDYVEVAAACWRKSFAQFGEDLFLLDHFGERTGLYIDVGGNHPFRLSNTYLLYRRGWSGLVVEPIQRLCAKHLRFRPRDIQVNAAAGSTDGTLAFFELLPSGLSTCNLRVAEASVASQSARLLREYTVPIVTIADLYREYLAPQPVLLLSVDTEGNDISVLRGVDWKVVCPEIVICEANDDTAGAEVVDFLSRHGYRVVRVFGCNIIFSRC